MSRLGYCSVCAQKFSQICCDPCAHATHAHHMAPITKPQHISTPTLTPAHKECKERAPRVTFVIFSALFSGIVDSLGKSSRSRHGRFRLPSHRVNAWHHDLCSLEACRSMTPAKLLAVCATLVLACWQTAGGMPRPPSGHTLSQPRARSTLQKHRLTAYVDVCAQAASPATCCSLPSLSALPPGLVLASGRQARVPQSASGMGSSAIKAMAPSH